MGKCNVCGSTKNLVKYHVLGDVNVSDYGGMHKEYEVVLGFTVEKQKPGSWITACPEHAPSSK